MNYVILLLSIALMTFSCQSERTDFSTGIINVEALENNADDITSSRKTEGFRAKVSLRGLENEVVVIADLLREERSIAYVLQTEATPELAAIDLNRAWVVYLQDHLVIIDEESNRKIHLSLANRALNSPVISEEVTFTDLINGYGIARYSDQVVRPEQLEGVNSYLEARSMN